MGQFRLCRRRRLAGTARSLEPRTSPPDRRVGTARRCRNPLRARSRRWQSDEVEETLGNVDPLFRTFMDESPLAAWIVDADDRLMYSSEPFPLTEEERGTSMWDQVPDEHIAPYREALHRARATGHPQQVTAMGPRTVESVTTDGWFQAHYFPLHDG